MPTQTSGAIDLFLSCFAFAGGAGAFTLAASGQAGASLVALVLVVWMMVVVTMAMKIARRRLYPLLAARRAEGEAVPFSSFYRAFLPYTIGIVLLGIGPFFVLLLSQ